MPSIDARAESVTGGGGEDPPSPTTGGEDYRSLAAEFWRALNEGDVGLAREAARRIEPPAATSFVFDKEEEDGGEPGASPAAAAGETLSAGTPAVVEQAWNSSKQVNVILGSDEWCLAAVTTTMRTGDFTACTLGRRGTHDGCPKTTHAVVGGRGKTSVLRLDVADPKGMLVIVTPVSRAAVKQTACFSRPTLRLSAYPAELLAAGRWKPLLDLWFRPLVWRVLFEAFDRGNAAYEEGGSRKSPPGERRASVKPPPRDPVSLKLYKLTLGEEESRGLKEEDEEVTVAPGLESVPRDYGVAAAREAPRGRGLMHIRFG